MKKTASNSGQDRRYLALARNQGGQVGIIILLMTVVMLTVGISAVSRTTSDVNISSTNEQSNRALDAAESDVEKALSGSLIEGTTSRDLNGNKIDTTVNRYQELTTSVDQGNTVGVDLVGSSGVVNIEWARENVCNAQASLVISLLSSDPANPIRRFYVGPSGLCSRSGNDNFSAPTGAGTGTYKYRFAVSPAANETLMRIRPLYNGTDLKVSGGNLPTQAYTVTSTAQNTTSKETKAVQVTRTLPVAPSVLDYVLFSGTTITQQ